MEITIVDIDSIPISDLQDRYGLGRSGVHNRLKAANIEPEKRGKRSFVSQAQLAILDQQDMQVKSGTALVLVPQEPIELSSQIETYDLSDLLKPYRVLQEAVDKQWVLTTAIVRLLIGAKPRGRSYQKLGFEFDRTDRMDEWIVTKPHQMSAEKKSLYFDE